MRTRSDVLDVVERRPADDGVLSQSDRTAHRDDRQPDADRDSVRAGRAAAQRAICRFRSRRSAGTSASRSSTRSPRIAPCSTSRRGIARRCCSTSTAMGQNAIERGSRDTWTFSPRRVAALRAATDARGTAPTRAYEQLRDAAAARPARLHPAGGPAGLPDRDQVRRRAAQDRRRPCTARPPRSRSTASTYPAGSFVVKTAQAFRPHVLDMFEPQDHPDDFPYPGGPPTPPYDSAGWTLAFQMGVKFDRVLDGFDGPFERVSTVSHPPGRVDRRRAAGGLSRQPSSERRVHRRQPAAESGRERVLAGRSPHRRRSVTALGAMYIRRRAATRRCSRKRQRILGSRSPASRRRRKAGRSSCGRCASACGIATADPARAAGCAGSSSASSSPSRWSTRRRSMAASSASSFDVHRPGQRRVAVACSATTATRRRAGCRRNIAAATAAMSRDAHAAAVEAVRRGRRHADRHRRRRRRSASALGLPITNHAGRDRKWMARSGR